MFLRWMIRDDNRGVDFGLWKKSQHRINAALDIHTGNISDAWFTGAKTKRLKAVKNNASLRSFDEKNR
jgi:hypothetical protein